MKYNFPRIFPKYLMTLIIRIAWNLFLSLSFLFPPVFQHRAGYTHNRSLTNVHINYSLRNYGENARVRGLTCKSSDAKGGEFQSEWCRWLQHDPLATTDSCGQLRNNAKTKTQLIFRKREFGDFLPLGKGSFLWQVEI